MRRKMQRKRTIVESKAKPEIYVKITRKVNWWLPISYARAHIRIKSDGYQYLQWRDGNRVRSLYLGRKRKS